MFLGLERLAQIHILLLISYIILLDYGIIRALCHHTLNIKVSRIDWVLAEELKTAACCIRSLIIIFLFASWEAQRQIANRGGCVLHYHDRLGLATNATTKEWTYLGLIACSDTSKLFRLLIVLSHRLKLARRHTAFFDCHNATLVIIL